MAQSLRLERIDLFDGPSWEASGFWDTESKGRSRWVIAGQLTASLLACLAIPVCFTAVLAALMWDINSMFTWPMF